MISSGWDDYAYSVSEFEFFAINYSLSCSSFYSKKLIMVIMDLSPDLLPGLQAHDH